MRSTSCAVAAVVLAFGAACGSSGATSDDGGSLVDATGGSSSGNGTLSGGSSGSSSGAGASSGDAGRSGSSGGSSGAGSSSSSGSSGGPGSSSGAGGSSSSSGSGSGGDGGAPSAFDVLQHHKNPSRNGVYVEPTFTKAAIATMHTTTLMGTVSTQVYAQPLYVDDGPGGVPLFIVATEENHVTAVNATTGATVWDTGPSVLGTPAARTALMCGDISPIGITGTPVIDRTAGVIYLDALTTISGTVTHRAFALNLSDGKVVTNWPVDISAKISGFLSHAQNQRGALQLVGGTLFIPYGGNDGDCDTYRGYVVGIPVATPQSPIAWHTAATEGGIWGPGSLPSDGTSIFPVTGNSKSQSAWGQSESVLRLGTTLTFSNKTADYYYPTNWQTSLDAHDIDLGGANDVLLDMPGAAHPHLIAQGGKDGNLYLLDRDNLGGMGGELLKVGVATSEIKGAPAAYTTSSGTYVAFHVEAGSGTTCPNTGSSGNVIAVKITAGPPLAASVAWCASQSNLASPMVTTTDGTSNAVVWAANGALWGYDGDSGALLAGGASGSKNTSFPGTIQGWNLPIAAHGKMALGYSGALYVFTP